MADADPDVEADERRDKAARAKEKVRRPCKGYCHGADASPGAAAQVPSEEEGRVQRGVDAVAVRLADAVSRLAPAADPPHCAALILVSLAWAMGAATSAAADAAEIGRAHV